MKKVLISILAILLSWMVLRVDVTQASYTFGFQGNFVAGFEGGFRQGYFVNGGGANDLFASLIHVGLSGLVTPQNLVIGSTHLTCHKQVRGVYYNGKRGNRLFPLDAMSRTSMITDSSTYNDLTLSGGLFTSCDGQPINAVFGQVFFDIGGEKTFLVAGVEMNSGNNTYTPNLNTGFWHGITYVYGELFDSVAGVGIITGSVYVPVALNGSIALSGGVNGYVSGTLMVHLRLTISDAASFQISGAGMVGQAWGTFPSAGTYAQFIDLTLGDGQKNLSLRLWTGLSDVTVTGHVMLDTTPPSPFNLLNPGSGAVVGTSITLSWLPSNDTGVGLASPAYYWEVSGNNFLMTGFTNSMSQSIVINDPGVYFWKVKARDRLGWETDPNPQMRSFQVDTTVPSIVSNIPFSFQPIFNATLNTLYTSNVVTLTGWGGQIAIVINTGFIVKNGINVGLSTTGFNGDEIALALTSSHLYDTVVSGIVFFDTLEKIFSVMTIDLPVLPSSPSPPSSSPSLGGGGVGGVGFSFDNCPGGDFSPSYYDGRCDGNSALAQNLSIIGQVTQASASPSQFSKIDIQIMQQSKNLRSTYVTNVVSLMRSIDAVVMQTTNQQQKQILNEFKNYLNDKLNNDTYLAHILKAVAEPKTQRWFCYQSVMNEPSITQSTHQSPNGNVFRIWSNGRQFISPDIVNPHINCFDNLQTLRGYIDVRNGGRGVGVVGAQTSSSIPATPSKLSLPPSASSLPSTLIDTFRRLLDF